MKIIFVGLHNKPMMKPLDSKTKTGKLIDRIIEKCNSLDTPTRKTNLFDIEFVPHGSGYMEELALNWWQRVDPHKRDVIVLLGAMVHNEFIKNGHDKIIKVAHPAIKRSHIEMNSYVERTFELIKIAVQSN